MNLDIILILLTTYPTSQKFWFTLMTLKNYTPNPHVDQM